MPEDLICEGEREFERELNRMQHRPLKEKKKEKNQWLLETVENDTNPSANTTEYEMSKNVSTPDSGPTVLEEIENKASLSGGWVGKKGNLRERLNRQCYLT